MACMIFVKTFPRNKSTFIRLKSFCKEILTLCKNLGVTPIAYGSLIYFGYTRDRTFPVHDVDFLIPEGAYKKLIPVLRKNKLRYRYYREWHQLHILKSGMKIDLDSQEFWQPQLSKRFTFFDFDGLVVKAVSLESLQKIYKRASKESKEKPREYLKKFQTLKGIKLHRGKT
jgi:hypothetical protein